MSDLLRQLMKGPELEETLYPPESRYHRVAVAELVREDGRVVRYLRRRFLPDPENFTTLRELRVARTDRMDLIAAEQLGSPLASWRIADANGLMQLDEIVKEPESKLRITLPEGVRGPSNA